MAAARVSSLFIVIYADESMPPLLL